MLRLATQKENIDSVVDTGDFAIFELSTGKPASGIMFVCPHEGCGDRVHLPLQPANPNGWYWDEEKKTLSPSILRMDEKRCTHHFSLIEGVWQP